METIQAGTSIRHGSRLEKSASLKCLIPKKILSGVNQVYCLRKGLL